VLSNRKKREIEIALNPQDSDLLALHAAVKEAFREQSKYQAKREPFEVQKAVLDREIGILTLELSRVFFGSQDYHSIKKRLELKKRTLLGVENQIAQFTTKISETQVKQDELEKMAHLRQEERKEELREMRIPLQIEYHQLNLLQQDIKRAAQQEPSTAPALPPLPRPLK
jgi:hypothetical protein